MINYNTGKIYKIEAINESNDDIYIGSATKDRLSQRMATHRQNYKNWKLNKTGRCMSFDLFEKYGVENCNIILLENVKANSRDELHAREAFYIKTMHCINKFIPLRTKKEWNDDNKETSTYKCKEYNEKNKDYIKARYDENKDEISARKREKVVCACGSIFSYGDKSKHEITKKHLKYLDSINGRSTITT